MPLTFANGSVLTNGTEQELFNITADKYFGTKIFLHNMASNNEVEIIVYVLDTNAGVMRKIWTENLNDVQANPCLHFAPVAAKQYRVTVRRVAGAEITITWERSES